MVIITMCSVIWVVVRCVMCHTSLSESASERVGKGSILVVSSIIKLFLALVMMVVDT
jgi:hypothetical protein